ncbi:transcriptional repressor [Candidatus Gracilibacteria bacterium]|nr:transcriptional repressor [Candidatus Gracilibacteria bacterium]
MDNNYPRKQLSITMNKSAQQIQIQKFIETCREKKLPITPQKIEIFTYLISTTIHPSAEKIWKEVQDVFPTISFATVYKNLKKFKDLGFIREIAMKDGTTRYDADMTPHHHVIHIENKKIWDVQPEEIGNFATPSLAKQFKIENVSVNFFVSGKRNSVLQ